MTADRPYPMFPTDLATPAKPSGRPRRLCDKGHLRWMTCAGWRLKRRTGMNVVIVESPAKAQTINKYLGNDYEVFASFGHVRDLPW